MEVKRVSGAATAVALGLLVACFAFAEPVFAAPAMPADGENTNRTAAAQTHSSSAGYELDYFHGYKASKTYVIRLKNGLHASFDFEQGTATLWSSSGSKTTFPLQQVLLQASNGNSQAAAEMYDQMYQDISTAHSDTIVSYAGPGTAGAHFSPPPRGDIGIGESDLSLWSTPTGGDCWPVPYPCHQWAGGLSDWGPYNNWWASGLGDPPPTPQPPNPDGCAPNDLDCRLWEHDRQDACDDLTSDTAWAYLLAGVAGASCGLAETGLGAIGCVGALASGARANLKRVKDSKTCRTPYPR